MIATCGMSLLLLKFEYEFSCGNFGVNQCGLYKQRELEFSSIITSIVLEKCAVTWHQSQELWNLVCCDL